MRHDFKLLFSICFFLCFCYAKLFIFLFYLIVIAVVLLCYYWRKTEVEILVTHAAFVIYLLHMFFRYVENGLLEIAFFLYFFSPHFSNFLSDYFVHWRE